MANSLIFLLLIFSFIPIANADLVYHMELGWLHEEKTDLFIINSYDDMPSMCKQGYSDSMIVVGCAIYGPNGYGQHLNIIFIYDKYMNQLDAYGMYPLLHEMDHILCQCDWHG